MGLHAHLTQGMCPRLDLRTPYSPGHSEWSLRDGCLIYALFPSQIVTETAEES